MDCLSVFRVHGRGEGAQTGGLNAWKRGEGKAVTPDPLVPTTVNRKCTRLRPHLVGNFLALVLKVTWSLSHNGSEGENVTREELHSKGKPNRRRF